MTLEALKAECIAFRNYVFHLDHLLFLESNQNHLICGCSPLQLDDIEHFDNVCPHLETVESVVEIFDNFFQKVVEALSYIPRLELTIQPPRISYLRPFDLKALASRHIHGTLVLRDRPAIITLIGAHQGETRHHDYGLGQEPLPSLFVDIASPNCPNWHQIAHPAFHEALFDTVLPASLFARMSKIGTVEFTFHGRRVHLLCEGEKGRFAPLLDKVLSHFQVQEDSSIPPFHQKVLFFEYLSKRAVFR